MKVLVWQPWRRRSRQWENASVSIRNMGESQSRLFFLTVNKKVICISIYLFLSEWLPPLLVLLRPDHLISCLATVNNTLENGPWCSVHNVVWMWRKKEKQEVHCSSILLLLLFLFPLNRRCLCTCVYKFSCNLCIEKYIRCSSRRYLFPLPLLCGIQQLTQTVPPFVSLNVHEFSGKIFYFWDSS